MYTPVALICVRADDSCSRYEAAADHHQLSSGSEGRCPENSDGQVEPSTRKAGKLRPRGQQHCGASKMQPYQASRRSVLVQVASLPLVFDPFHPLSGTVMNYT
jgi:hypothetical protein